MCHLEEGGKDIRRVLTVILLFTVATSLFLKSLLALWSGARRAYARRMHMPTLQPYFLQLHGVVTRVAEPRKLVLVTSAPPLRG